MRNSPGGKYADLPIYHTYTKEEHEAAARLFASDPGVESIHAVNQNIPPLDTEPAAGGANKHTGAAAQRVGESIMGTSVDMCALHADHVTHAPVFIWRRSSLTF